MKNALVAKKDFFKFINDVIQGGTEIIAPVPQENQANFKQIKSSKEIIWGAPQTVIPAKGLLFPQEEELLEYEVDGGIKIKAVVKSKPLILLGIHACDINGTLLLDKVFAEKNLDENYLKKRENLTIIGVDCLLPCSPESFCFRKDSLEPWDGFDLFLTEMGHSFFVQIGTEKGKKLAAGITKEATKSDLEKIKKVKKKRGAIFDKKQPKLLPRLNDLPKLLKESYDSPYWDELGRKDLNCGSCNLVCPTCYCFDVRDGMELSLKHGKRSRFWDGCLLTNFTRVASGEVFREDRGARLRHRTSRKDRYLFEKWGHSFCTGCGRCVKACLPKICNPLEIANTLYERQNKK